MFFILAMFFYFKNMNALRCHTNLRLCDKVTDIDYTEQTINWSHSESESDAE